MDGDVWAVTDLHAGKPCGSTIIHGNLPLEVAYVTTDGKPYLSVIFEGKPPTKVSRAKFATIAAKLMLYSTLVNNMLSSLPPEKKRRRKLMLVKALRDASKATTELAESRRVKPEDLH